MKVAIAGKGGSGKTTVAGTLARSLARLGNMGVVAIDADSNPNLALTLGLSREAAAALAPMQRDAVLERVVDGDGRSRWALRHPAEQVIREHGVDTPDGVRLLLMGRVSHAGAG